MTLIALTDLRKQFGKVRFQGERQTCLSIADSEAHQHIISLNELLSVEWLFYHACQMPGNSPLWGTTVSATSNVLLNTGQPLESVWPYSTTSPKLLTWKPPKHSGKLYKIRTKPANKDILNTVWDELKNDRPTVISFTVSENFIFGPNSNTKTEVPIPNSQKDKDKVQLHAVTVAGLGYYKGKHVFLIRNSWGSEWGYNGYAWLYEDYLISRIESALTFQLQSI